LRTALQRRSSGLGRKTLWFDLQARLPLREPCELLRNARAQLPRNFGQAMIGDAAAIRSLARASREKLFFSTLFVSTSGRRRIRRRTLRNLLTGGPC